MITKPDIVKSVMENVEAGIKQTELVVKVVSDLFKGEDGGIESDFDSIVSVIKELIDRGEILELEYTLPHLSYRIKSFLLPKGSSITVKGMTLQI